MISSIKDWITAQLPAGAACAVGQIADHTAGLIGAEQDGISKAIQKRRNEFSTGRVLARDALSQLDEPPVSLPVGVRRQPVWPDHIVGSITHIGPLCAVVVAPKDVSRALGLDLAICADVGPRISERTSTPVELVRNADQVPPGDIHGCLFSIREAIFKSYYPHTGNELDFADVTVTLDAGRFCADIINPTRPDLFGQRQISGVFTLIDGYAISLICIP